MLNWHRLGSTAYANQRYDTLVLLEGVVKTPYLDTASPPAPTIGIGFNLEYHLGTVLRAIVGNAHWSQTLENRLQAVIDAGFSSGQNTLLQDRLNAVMREWHNTRDSDVPTTFAFATTAQIKAALATVSTEYEDIVTAKLGDIPDSEERVALFTLAYNSPALIGPKLTAAIQNGNRAEAWYEIRYNSNGSESLGIANRRYVEADTFDLFDDDSPSKAEAMKIGRMYADHRDDILSYEASFDPVSAGVTKGVAGIASILDEYAPAVAKLEAVFDIGPAFSFEELQVASSGNRRLTGDGTAHDDSGNNQDLLIGSVHANRLSGNGGNDGLIGLGGNDALFGGGGSDWLDGGAGNDTLSGGGGNDRYVYSGGNDKLVERPGSGNDFLIMRDAGTLRAANIEHLAIDDALGGLARVFGNDIRTIDLSSGNDRVTLVINNVKARASDVTIDTSGGKDRIAIVDRTDWSDWSDNGDPAKTFTFEHFNGNDRIDLRSFDIDKVVTGTEGTTLSTGLVLMAPDAVLKKGGSVLIENTTGDWVIASIDHAADDTFGPAFSGNITEDSFLI
ncbi:MAG: hypothetical protein C0606_11675 [Hyphomicrobiales bacterium]|nr:MAG: hypothetical protein C0606_11675 [Hyphomicrobiales bacterium]